MEVQIYENYQYPRVSVIIPTFNSAQSLSITIDRVLQQKYPDLEIIVVDGGSKDLTLQLVKNYKDTRVHLYALSTKNRYIQINKGITQATGEYINVLFPGDFYVDHHVLKVMMEAALEKEKPHLIYCGTLLRDGRSDPKILYRNFNLIHLRQGQQPTSLQSCFIRKDVFEKIGKFSTDYLMRGGFDLMCRFLLNGKLTFASVRRVLTDYDLRLVTRPMIWTHFKESARVIYTYFGLRHVLKWFFRQKDLSRFFKSWWKSIKVALSGQG